LAPRIPINPGLVEWSGDNPGIYLRDRPDGPFVTLALFFKVVLSPHGSGTAMLVLGAPDQAGTWPQRPNLMITDNQAMARYLVDGFVVNMPTFRARPALERLAFLPLTGASTERHGQRHSERVTGAGLTAEMAWDRLETPFAVEVNPEQSATGTHQMYSIFVEAKAASVSVNGTRLAGIVTDRQLFGRTISTAFLAFSETWVKPVPT